MSETAPRRARSADAIIAGCPRQYNLLSSSAFTQCNLFLRGSRIVATNSRNWVANDNKRIGSVLSTVCPSVWYALFQSYVPYNSEGLDGRAIAAEVAAEVISEQDDDNGTREFQNSVWKMVNGIYGDQKCHSLRFGAWLLTHIFQWLYNGELYVRPEATATLREMASNTTFIYVPTHKSHLDYHMLSFILFSEGLACPHIAAGDNLNLPVVGSIMRTCGAFFIRRSLKGSADAFLYKRVLDAYMHTLLQHGISTEFFIEGGRTRDGRIAVPRLGLLSSSVDASLDKSISKPVCVVPVAISYDLPLEEQGLLLELLGQSKKKETIWQFLSAFGGLLLRLAGYMLLPRARALGCGGVRGRVAVAFGEPISVHKFLKERNRRRKKRTSGKKPPSSKAAGDDFDDILAEFAAMDQAQPEEDKDEPADARVSHSVAKLLDSMPPGSEARRSAVLALGTEIHTSLLKINVIPSSALLGAALLPHHVFNNKPPRRDAPPGATLAAVTENYLWLQTRIAQHGRTCMQLPSAPSTAARSAEVLVALARACGQYVDSRPSSARSEGAKLATFALRATPVAALWQHARLNYLLPVFGGHSLAVCAVLAAGGGRGGGRGEGGGGESGAGTCAQMVFERSASASAVVENILWLRRLLAAELDDAFGTDVLASRVHVNGLLSDLTEAGMLMAMSDSDGGANENGSAVSSYRAMKACAKDIIFAGSLLAPIIRTYTEVLSIASELLLERQVMWKADLTAEILARLAKASEESFGKSGARLPAVPSRLLVQNALRVWEQEGLLVAGSDEDANTPSSSQHGRLGNIPSCASSFNLNLPALQEALTQESGAAKASQQAAGGLAQIKNGQVRLPSAGKSRLASEISRLEQHTWW